MIRNLPVLAQILPRADVHPAINLPRIARKNLRSGHVRVNVFLPSGPQAVQFARQFHRIPRLPRSRRPEYAYKVNAFIFNEFEQFFRADCFRLRQIRDHHVSVRILRRHFDVNVSDCSRPL